MTGTRHIPESWTRHFELELMPGTLVEGAVNEDNECVWEREGEQVNWVINLSKFYDRGAHACDIM